MLEELHYELLDLFKLLTQRNTAFLCLALLSIVLILGGYTILSRKDLGIIKIIVLITAIAVMLVFIPFYSAYKFREDVYQYSSLTMGFVFTTHDFFEVEKSKGSIGRIRLFDNGDRTTLIVSNLRYPKDTLLDVSGLLHTKKSVSGPKDEHSLTKEIQEINIETDKEVSGSLKRNEEGYFSLPNYKSIYPFITIDLPKISFEGDFGLSFHFDSNFPIEEAEITLQDHLPVYVGDGELKGITSILYYNKEPKDTIERYVWFRRVALNHTMLIATFSVMLGGFYFLFSIILRLRKTNYHGKKDKIKDFWMELDIIKRNDC